MAEFSSNPRNNPGELPLQMTEHARVRLAQRNISWEAIRATLMYGKKMHRTGYIFFIMRKKDVQKRPELRPFHGTTILMGADGTVITAYANKNAPSMVKKKPKRRAISPEGAECVC